MSDGCTDAARFRDGQYGSFILAPLKAKPDTIDGPKLPYHVDRTEHELITNIWCVKKFLPDGSSEMVAKGLTMKDAEALRDYKNNRFREAGSKSE